MPEGSLCFADEPQLEVTAPVIEAQIAETYLLNQLTFQSALATKASRVVAAADGVSVVDFAARRTHGTDAAIKAARAGYIAGYAGTSNVQAAALYGMPPVGTMAHSFIMAFEHEIDAFRAYAETFPASTTLLVDTYDTVEGVRNAITTGLEMAEAGHKLQAVRLDSGDLGLLANESRRLLDEAGLTETGIFASGGLDEFSIERLIRAGAPIDGFGVGTRFGVSADAPYNDSAYKLVEFGGRPVHKLSPDKATLPGAKQTHRYSDGAMYDHDVVALAGDTAPSGAEPLLLTVMEDGRRTGEPESLDVIRSRFSREISRLPAEFKRLESPARYRVDVSDRLRALREEA